MRIIQKRMVYVHVYTNGDAKLAKEIKRSIYKELSTISLAYGTDIVNAVSDALVSLSVKADVTVEKQRRKRVITVTLK